MRPVLALALLATTSTAQAAGFHYTGVGIRSFSRGGAMIAGADNLLAMYHNPAALIRLERPQLMLDLAGVDQKVRFDRTAAAGNGPLDELGVPTDISYTTVENQAAPYAIPQLAFGMPVGDRMAFAFGLYPPYAPDFSYDPTGAQRYSLVDTTLIQTNLGPSFAFEANEWLTVGLGLTWNVLMVEQSVTVGVPFHSTDVLNALDETWSPAPNEDPANDVAFSLSAKDNSAFGWNVGFLIEPPEADWAVGIMVQPPVGFDAQGTMEASFEGHSLYEEGLLGQEVIISPTTKDESINLALTMPLNLKAGFLYRLSPETEIELAGVWQQWSTIDKITVTNVDLPIDLNEAFGEDLGMGGLLEDTVIDDDVILPAGYMDAWSIRLGGAHQFNDRFVLRAGGFYETSAIPTSSVNVSLVDGDKVGYGLGSSFALTDDVVLDFGMGQSFLAELQITDSQVTQTSVHPLTGEFLSGTTVGNGTINSSVTMFGAALNWLL